MCIASSEKAQITLYLPDVIRRLTESGFFAGDHSKLGACLSGVNGTFMEHLYPQEYRPRSSWRDETGETWRYGQRYG